MTHARLRFGLMCTGTRFTAWQARCIEELVAVPGVELALLIVDDRPGPSPRLPARVARWARSDTFAWKTFNDGWVARRAASVQPVDLAAELAGVPELRCTVTTKGKYSEYFDASDVDRIEAAQLDFILRFAFGIVRGPVLDAARLGIWSFHHDDEACYRGGPPCFWEVYERAPVTGFMLQRLTERLDAGVVLEKGFVRTVPWSYTRNADGARAAAAAFPAKVCRELLAGAPADAGTPVASEAPIRRNPTNRQMLTFLRRQAASYVREQVRSTFFYDQWNVGVVDAPIARFLDDGYAPAPRWLPECPPASHYIADPFGVPGRDEMLFEVYDRQTGLGVIRADASPGPSVLPVDVHASYPSLFEHDGDVYCVPEIARHRGVHLFRALDYPRRWEHAACLVPDVAAIDPTVFASAGRWWCFFTDKDVDANATLHVWHAADLLGPWSPHAGNPVKTDVRSARPAGTPFVHDGRLYRPAQDCSRSYGGSIVLNEVDHLTPTCFSERTVRVLHARTGRYSHGLHTVSAAGGRTLIDAKRRVFAGRNLLRVAVSKGRRAVSR